MSEYIYTIYKHVSPNGKAYIGQTKRYKARLTEHKKSNNVCKRFANAIKKHGWDTFKHIILEENLTLEHANIWEEFYIKAHKTLSPNGYNLRHGGNNRQWSTESKNKIFLKAKQRVEDGTHNFLGGEISRKTQKTRVEDGTHNFLGGNNPSHKRVADGTHNFVDGEISRKTQKTRVEDGTHHLLGGYIQQKNAKKRLKDGTHNLLNPISWICPHCKKTSKGAGNFSQHINKYCEMLHPKS